MSYMFIPKIILALATGFLVPALVVRLVKWPTSLSRLVWLAGLAASVGLLFLDASLLQSLLVIPWFCLTLYVALIGIKRFAVWLIDDTGMLLVSIGCIHLSIGGVWLLVSTNASAFFGYLEPWKTLTAVHFHFAAFLFPVCVGLLSIATVRSISRSPWFKLFAIVYLMAVIMVAIGLNGHRTTELIGVTLITGSGISLLFSLLFMRGRTGSSSILLNIGIVLGMSALLLSLLHTWRFDPLLSLDSMAMTHGLINGVLFLPVLVYFTIKWLPTVDLDRHIPFSRLRAKSFVGPKFFESFDEHSAEVPRGLVDDFRVFGTDDLRVDDIDRRVVDFYENTGAYNLRVNVRRAIWYRCLWDWLAGPIFKLFGQLNLPRADKNIIGRMTRLNSEADGRDKPVGWIRTDESTGEVVYMAAYSTHEKNGISYMNIAFPLPFSNMSSILYVTHGHNPGGIELTSLGYRNPGGDQGVFLVTRFINVRLPLNERIHVWWEGELRAKHEMWFLGLKYMTLDYVMIRS